MELIYVLCFAALVGNIYTAESGITFSDILKVLQTNNGSDIQHNFLENEYHKLTLPKRPFFEKLPINSQNIIKKVSFDLYTRSSPTHRTQLTPSKLSLTLAKFDIRKPLRVMTHGFWSSADSDASQEIKNAYLTYADVNVILVDWKYYANSVNYIKAADNTLPIGKYLAALLNVIIDYGLNPINIHLVGHSLGAHISGFAGKFAKAKVARITGLDPAGPLFESFKLINGYLAAGDAQFVDIIHTSAGALGFRNPVGDIDFYPNNGTAPQPGCINFVYILGQVAEMIDPCSHGRSWKYFAESINPNERYKSYKCSCYENAMPCYESINYMGEYVNANDSGVFHLHTNSRSPFAID